MLLMHTEVEPVSENVKATNSYIKKKEAINQTAPKDFVSPFKNVAQFYAPIS